MLHEVVLGLRPSFPCIPLFSLFPRGIKALLLVSCQRNLVVLVSSGKTSHPIFTFSGYLPILMNKLFINMYLLLQEETRTNNSIPEKRSMHENILPGVTETGTVTETETVTEIETVTENK